uniref:PDZ domain-containing protein n=1 Tax=Globisporangium ultimum (strain ATCC 200006 / CBS 805.95 / DAOM BR144) TaxID=431595 RepID=K3X2R1_GLOUD
MEPIGRFHASSMASYLRSAIAASTSATKSSSAPQPVDAGASLSSPEEQQSKGETSGVLTPPLDPACDAAADEDILLSEKQLAAFVSVCKDRQDDDVGAGERGATYQVHYECAPDVDDGCSDDACSDSVKLCQKDSAVKVHYIDVLLRADVHGLGLNIEVAEGSQTALKASSNRLVVASFRRLHGDDIGPAEATGQIQRGDTLYSVDGTPVHSLQQLQAQLRVSRSRGEEGDDRASSRFVLLRFLRYTESSKLESDDAASTTSLTADEDVEVNQLDAKDITMPHSLASPFADKQQVTMMLRSLVMKNQALQDELMASRLKQAEQSIQLEQLYALYARTQVDSAASGFSLSKTLRPFARKASTSVGASRSNSSGAPPLVTLKSEGASFSSSITSPLHVEIEFAVQAERERLQAHYQLQREIETHELVLRHEQELQALKETMDKKLEMLECGFHEALRKLESESLTLSDASTATNSIETCSCGAWMRLQQELYIHQSLEHDGGEEGDDQESAQCVVCHLLTDARRGSVDKHDPAAEDENGSQAKRMQQVMEALHEYDRIKQDRALYLKKYASETTDGKTFNVAARELRLEESESSQP